MSVLALGLWNMVPAVAAEAASNVMKFICTFTGKNGDNVRFEATGPLEEDPAVQYYAKRGVTVQCSPKGEMSEVVFEGSKGEFPQDIMDRATAAMQDSIPEGERDHYGHMFSLIETTKNRDEL